MQTNSTNKVEVGRAIDLEMKAKRYMEIPEIIEEVDIIETGITKLTNITEVISMKRRKNKQATTRAKVMPANTEVDLGLGEEEWMMIIMTQTK